MPNFRRTTWFIDADKIRTALRDEMGVRGASQVRVAEETGILATGVGRFLSRAQTLQGDALMSLVKWMGMDPNRFLTRRGRISSHRDSYEQQQLRKALAYLKSQGVEVQPGESPVDALMALVAKSNG